MDEERVAGWRWGLYIISTTDAIFIPLIGEVVEGTAGDVLLITLYIVWAASLALFGATFFERTSSFIIRCLYYLLCSIAPLAFFGSFAGAALNQWLPVSSCLGIFIGIALHDCFSQTIRSARQSIRRILLRWLGLNEPLLPHHRPRIGQGEDTHPPYATSHRSVATIEPALSSQVYLQQDSQNGPHDGSQQPPNSGDNHTVDPRTDN